MCSIFVNFPREIEETVYSTVIGGNVLLLLISESSLIVLLQSSKY